MHIHFFHGRKTIDEQMNDWGEDGPVIKISGVTWTYGSLKLHDDDWDFVFIRETEGLIPIGDMYYGDFEILPNTAETSPHWPVLTLQTFEQLNEKQDV